jgi:hypothetical protein
MTPLRRLLRAIAIAWVTLLCSYPQTVEITRVPSVEIPTRVDGNSPTFWADGFFNYITSTGAPVIVQGEDQFGLYGPQLIAVDRMAHLPMWIESVWQDPDGALYGWYHHEPGGICVNNNLTAPEIGAVVSRDGGRSFEDLGIVLKAGDVVDCTSRNGFFAGGHGDFSVILNREQTHFYFLFTNYGGDISGQGVVMARLSFDDRKSPAGNVWKYFQGEWSEPGIGGKATPVFPARVSWQRADTDSFWGPAVHWNTYLQQYVVLLNHACCGTNWPQEGIYAAFNADIAKPDQWTSPYRILQDQDIGFGPGYYPQVIGLGSGETDTIAGQTARLYIQGRSNWQIVFNALTREPAPAPEPVSPPVSRGEPLTDSVRRRRN